MLNEAGVPVLRDLEAEAEGFTIEKYNNGEFDAFNYVWYENFCNYEHGANGCDYERQGCFIRPGDVVLDVGANVGVFSRRAEERGASRVIALEPVTPTHDVCVLNRGPKTEIYKLGLSDVTSFPEFVLHTNFTHIGGGSSMTPGETREIIHRERALCLNVNEFFDSGLFDRVDFLKVDIEGGEYGVFREIRDEHLLKMRCVALELHSIFDDVQEYQDALVARLQSLGFFTFVLYYGDKFLRTITAWKKEE